MSKFRKKIEAEKLVSTVSPNSKQKHRKNQKQNPQNPKIRGLKSKKIRVPELFPTPTWGGRLPRGGCTAASLLPRCRLGEASDDAREVFGYCCVKYRNSSEADPIWIWYASDTHRICPDIRRWHLSYASAYKSWPTPPRKTNTFQFVT